MKMGRAPTVNSTMPPGMRPRKQKSGKTYYYLDTGGKPRKEIPLGSDYILAVKNGLIFSKARYRQTPLSRSKWCGINT